MPYNTVRTEHQIYRY